MGQRPGTPIPCYSGCRWTPRLRKCGHVHHVLGPSSSSVQGKGPVSSPGGEPTFPVNKSYLGTNTVQVWPIPRPIGRKSKRALKGRRRRHEAILIQHTSRGGSRRSSSVHPLPHRTPSLRRYAVRSTYPSLPHRVLLFPSFFIRPFAAAIFRGRLAS